MQNRYRKIKFSLALAGLAFISASAFASSHMDAPLIILDPAANTTDVYAFVSQRINGTTGVAAKYLTVALAVYPFEEPGSGPNAYKFDPNVTYAIYVINGSNDLASGTADIGYMFNFQSVYQNNQTILQSYTGVVNDVGDTNQNFVQTYTVTKVDYRHNNTNIFLGTGIVPPNNQGFATPFYNQGDNGDAVAKPGVSTEPQLDRYTMESVTNLDRGYAAFAGQRDDGFYGDVEAVFDLLKLRNPGKDSQGGFNVHTIVLNIPVSDIGGEKRVAGVYAATYRRQMNVLRDGFSGPSLRSTGTHVQVARQGNPLFNELFVAIADKDLYSRTTPKQDQALFSNYALNPELAHLLNTLVFTTPIPDIENNRTDLAAIFIPDVIKVDLSTQTARLAGGGGNNPDDPGFSRLSIFGGDTLVSTVQTNVNGGVIPGGWPNGRRFGDDVVDIALTAVISDLRTNPPTIRMLSDNVNQNDIPYSKVFPYAATPHNGRDHAHP